MVPASQYVDTLMLAAEYALPGTIVECGVWRGGMIAGIAETVGPQRPYYLCDSFEGLPPARTEDGPAAKAYQSNPADPDYFDNCRSEQGWAERAMKLAKAHDVTILKGWFNDTIPTLRPATPIALLRLDADWYESTRVCLQHLYPLVLPGGLILIDDYYTWDGCTKAVNEYLATLPEPERIRSTPSGVAYILRGSGGRK